MKSNPFNLLRGWVYEEKREPSLVKFYRFIRGIGYVYVAYVALLIFVRIIGSDPLRKICIDP